MKHPLVISSAYRASDGGYVAIADVAGLLEPGSYRLIGGTTVMLHLHRLQLDLPVRATADADIGVHPALLIDDAFVGRIEALGYSKTADNRWERALAGAGEAAIDLLVPAYTSRARSSVQIGSTNTTEVLGLAVALKRPGIDCDLRLMLTTGDVIAATVSIPDEPSTLGLKLMARRVRSETRDATDIWRCMEIVYAAGAAEEFASHPDFSDARDVLRREMGPNGAALAVATDGLGNVEGHGGARGSGRCSQVLRPPEGVKHPIVIPCQLAPTSTL